MRTRNRSSSGIADSSPLLVPEGLKSLPPHRRRRFAASTAVVVPSLPLPPAVNMRGSSLVFSVRLRVHAQVRQRNTVKSVMARHMHMGSCMRTRRNEQRGGSYRPPNELIAFFFEGLRVSWLIPVGVMFAISTERIARADESPLAEVTSDRLGTELQQSYEGHWERVCIAPCSAHMLPRGLYRMDGSGMTPSSTFSPPQSGGPLKLNVFAGSSRLRAAGTVSASVGITGLLFSLVVLPVTYGADIDACAGDCAGRTFRTAAWVSAGVGAALVGLGVGLMFAGATDVREEASGRILAHRSAPRLRLTARGVAF